MFMHTGPRMTLDPSKTGLVLTDMHNDFLSPGGGAFALIEKSLVENDTARHLEELLAGARAVSLPIFISPHFYYPHDHRWVAPLTPLEDLAHRIGLLGRRDPFSLDGFEGSGADFPRAAIVTLAIDGLMMRESLRISPFTDQQRDQVVRELMKIADESYR